MNDIRFGFFNCVKAGAGLYLGKVLAKTLIKKAYIAMQSK